MQASTKTPGQLYALVIGAVYLLVGLVGFFVVSEFTKGSADDKLIIFRLNHVHNLVHIVLGVGWLAASRTVAAAKSVNTLFGVVLLLVAALGFTGIDLVHTLFNITESTDPDNFLHLVTGGIALYFGTVGAAGTREVAA
jgi:Domain of unknown function (DUF4383)